MKSFLRRGVNHHFNSKFAVTKSLIFNNNHNFSTISQHKLKELKEKEQKILNEDIFQKLNEFEDRDKEINSKKVKSYKSLNALYSDKQDYLEKLRLNFEDLRQLFIKANEDIEDVRSKAQHSMNEARDEAMTKFAKDLLEVIDQFQILEKQANSDKILESDNKEEVFNNLIEGNIVNNLRNEKNKSNNASSI